MLPDVSADQPHRRARLEREARLLAALNHPHIATIHDLLATEAGVPVLVLELVEGESLDVRLHRGALPPREALSLGCQIAEALEAAHDRGILHRDLKPSNVKLTREGKAKLLDFGLAKAIVPADGEPDGVVASTQETLSSPADATGDGGVLGTAPYMSPEQARGEEIDKRTDVWAFGCLLYEMLTSRRAFGGSTRADTIAAIVTRDPDWGALPVGTPPAVVALLRCCLRKDKSERLRDVADARIELKDALEESASRATLSATGRGSAPWALVARRVSRPLWVAVLVFAAGVLSWAAWSRLSVPSERMRLTISPPGEVRLLDDSTTRQHLALAPDGRSVVFMGRRSTDDSLFLREAGEIEAREIPHSAGASTPFFSPDGQWLGFARASHLLKVPVEGGSPIVVCEIPNEAEASRRARGVRGASWAQDGSVVFTPEPYSGLWRVPAEGGLARPLTTLDPSRNETGHRWPQVLPDGRSVLFTIMTRSTQQRDARIAVASLETGAHQVILEGSGFARYLSSGQLLYAKSGSILAVAFDPKKRAIAGPPATVLEDVQTGVGGHLYSDLEVSASGAVAYVPGGPRLVESSLLSVDREGRATPLSARRGSWGIPRISPDGRRLALAISSDPERSDLWRLDIERDTWERLTTAGGAGWGWPAWSPDGSRVAFSLRSASGTSVMVVPTDGSRDPVRVAETPNGIHVLDDWTPDGRDLVFSEQNSETGWDIGTHPVAGGTTRYLLANRFMECCAALSPDGRWMAYGSDETSRYEVYVRRFPDLAGKERVSTQGGIQPRWSRDGRELFYRSIGDRPKIMAAAIETRPRLRIGAPKALFDDVYEVNNPYNPAHYDVAADGRFVFVEKPPDSSAPRQIVLIPNFTRELMRESSSRR